MSALPRQPVHMLQSRCSQSNRLVTFSADTLQERTLTFVGRCTITADNAFERPCHPRLTLLTARVDRQNQEELGTHVHCPLYCPRRCGWTERPPPGATHCATPARDRGAPRVRLCQPRG